MSGYSENKPCIDSCAELHHDEEDIRRQLQAAEGRPLERLDASKFRLPLDHLLWTKDPEIFAALLGECQRIETEAGASARASRVQTGRHKEQRAQKLWMKVSATLDLVKSCKAGGTQLPLLHKRNSDTCKNLYFTLLGKLTKSEGKTFVWVVEWLHGRALASFSTFLKHLN